MAETGESVGVARIDIVADTATFDAEVKRAKNLISGLGPEGEKSFAKMTQAQKRATVAALKFEQGIGKSREEVRLLSLAAKGAAPEALERVRQKLLDTRSAAQSMGTQFATGGKSAKEMAFAMRGLPAQITDITTSLATGQPPLRVFLQQGGQLKDMFGGIRPAAAAVGSQLLKLINPFTATAAAAGLLLFAFKQATDDQQAFAKALLTSGNYVDSTVPKLNALAEALANATGATRGSARDAIQQVVASGQFASDQFQLVTEAALRMETATGQSLDTTIQKFKEIGDDPVRALLKLNKTEHFLTQAELDRVQTLIDVGKQQDAAAEGARIYAGRLDDVAAAADAARPHLTRMWSDAKHELGDLWEDTKNYTEYLAAASEKFQQTPWWKRITPFGGFTAAISALRNAEPTPPPVTPQPVAGAVNSKAEEAARKARAELAKFAAPSVKLKKAAQDAEQTFLAAIYGVSDPATIAKYAAQMNTQIEQAREAQARAMGGGGGGSKAPKFDPDRYRQKALDDIQKEIQAEGKLADARARAAAADVAFKAQLDQQLQTRKAAIDLQVKSIGMGQKEFSEYSQVNRVYQEFDRQLARLNRERDAGSISIDQYNKRLAELRQNEADTVEAVTNGFKAADLARSKAMNGMTAAIADFIDQQRDLAEQTRQFTTNFIDGFGDAFASFASGTESAKDAFGSFIDSMYQQALKFLANQAIQKLLQLGQTGPSGLNAGFFGMFNEGAAENTATGIIGSILGDGRAAGGPVRAGGLYPVVEDGPELLSVGSRSYLMMGAQSGTVTPNSQIRNVGSNKPQQIINVNVQPTNTRRTAEQVANAVARKQRIAAARNG